ncbi:MAG: FUSC family protein [Agathobacter sp.]|nr:FUSC family protein [Agathobacter sp.]
MEKLNDNFFEDDELDIDYEALAAIEDVRTSDHKVAKHFRFHVGLRNVKTAIAATLCALLYAFFERNPTFACIGAIFGMGSDFKDSKRSGGNRLFGTIIGGLIGMGLFYIYIQYYPEPTSNFRFMLFELLFVGIILLVLVCQLLVIPGAIQPAGVVLCIIMFNTPVDQFITYPLNRIFDTAIGVIIGIAVNMLISRERVAKVKKFLHLTNKKDK